MRTVHAAQEDENLKIRNNEDDYLRGKKYGALFRIALLAGPSCVVAGGHGTQVSMHQGILRIWPVS